MGSETVFGKPRHFRQIRNTLATALLVKSSRNNSILPSDTKMNTTHEAQISATTNTNAAIPTPKEAVIVKRATSRFAVTSLPGLARPPTRVACRRTVQTRPGTYLAICESRNIAATSRRCLSPVSRCASKAKSAAMPEFAVTNNSSAMAAQYKLDLASNSISA